MQILKSCRARLDKCADIAPLALRVALGAIFVVHGYGKVFTTGVEGVSGFLGQLGFPIPLFFAYVLSYGEIIGGVMLIAGILTYFAATFAGIVGVVAWVLVHLPYGFLAQNNGYEFIMLITAAAVSVLITGAGKYSLDAFLQKRASPPMA